MTATRDPRPARLFRAALHLVPARWRAAVARDLAEERAGAPADRRADRWLIWQALRIALRLRAADVVAALRLAVGDAGRGLGADLRLAPRLVRREPASSAAVVVTLALGIGAATATYAVFNAMLFRPVPGLRDPDRLVTIHLESPDRPGELVRFSGSAMVAAVRGTPALEGPTVGYKATVSVSAGDNGVPDLRDVMVVRDQYASVFGMRARIGRLISDEEARSGADVAIISERYWRSAFAASPAAIGASLRVDDHPFLVVGVVDGFEGWGASRVGTVSAWIPGGSGELLSARTRKMDDLLVVGRLRPGVTRAVAEQQARAAYARAPRAPTDVAGAVPVVISGLHASGADAFTGEVDAIYPLALGGAGVLLLLACANAANLLLARMGRRARALAVRAALGAGRGRLLRGVLIETGVLATASVMAGLGVANAFTYALRGTRPFRSGPALVDIPIDWRVVVFASIAGTLTLLMCGVLPALAASRVDPRALVHQSGRATVGERRARRVLVAVQLALAVVLVASAGVLTRSVAYLRGLPLGLQPGHVVEFSFDMLDAGNDPPAVNPFVSATLARLASTAGVEAVGVASPAALEASAPARAFIGRVRRPGAAADTAVQAVRRHVSGGYFAALRIPVLRGRTFAEGEYAYQPDNRPSGVAVISEALSRRLFGSVDVVGQHVSVSRAWGDPAASARDLEIVGVAGDTRSGWQYTGDDGPSIYEPDMAIYMVATFYVRSPLPPREMEARLREVMHELAPSLPLRNLATLAQERDALFPEERMTASLGGVVAGLAFVLALFGVAAVMACTLSERTRELGIRVALGASRRRLTRDVVRPAIMTAAAGVVAGLLLFAAVSRVLAARVQGVHALDPLTLAVTTVGLLAAAWAAAWVPTRRAARIDPTAALRSE